MTIALRPHHLLCMLSYVGKGYSAAFVANYTSITRRLSAGEEIEIVSGPDDICQPRLTDPSPHHCFDPGISQRDQQAATALEPILGLPITPGLRFHLNGPLLKRLRAGFRSGETRRACKACQWASLCDQIAAEDFQSAKLG